MKTKKLVMLLCWLGVATVLGCQPETKRTTNGGKETGAAESTSSTDHRAAGPGTAAGLGHVEHESSNGHPFRFEPSEFSGAWLGYSHNDVIRVYIMEPSGKKPVRVQVDSIAVFRPDGAVFTLDPDEIDAGGMTDSFSLDNRDLAIAMNLGANVVMEIGDKIYRADIPAGRK